MPDLTAALERLEDEASVFKRLITAIQVVRSEAVKDPLTPLGNQRALKQELERSVQRGTPHFVVFGDLTGFKSINDKHGHEVGDGVILHVGTWLKDIADKHGVSAFRQSGDEFVLVGEQTMQKNVCAALDTPIPPFILDGSPIPVAANFGVTDLNAAPLLALKNAEQACACAKQSGIPVATWTGELPQHSERRWRCGKCNASIRVECPPGSQLMCPVCRAAGPDS